MKDIEIEIRLIQQKDAPSFELAVSVMFTDSPYWPEVKLFYYGMDAYLSTILRKEHEGVWYAVHHTYSKALDGPVHKTGEDLLYLLPRMIELVYHSMMFLLIDPKLMNRDRCVFRVDRWQASELQRLTGVM